MKIRNVQLLILVLFSLFSLHFVCGYGELKAGERRDPKSIFYRANTFYESGEFEKAVKTYNEILARGFESKEVYYNMANTYMKMGRLGLAILNYERAMRIAPGDPDIRSNLEYANSLTEDFGIRPSKKWWVRKLEGITSSLSLERLALVMSILYFLCMALFSFTIIYPLWRKRLIYIFVFFVAILLFASTSFGLRFRDAEWLKPAIVISQEEEGKFEPFEKSTTYFKVHEGSKVFVLKEKGSWIRIRRLDGKAAWIKKNAVEII